MRDLPKTTLLAIKSQMFVVESMPCRAFFGKHQPQVNDILWTDDLLLAADVLFKKGLSNKVLRRIERSPKSVFVSDSFAHDKFAGGWANSNWKTVKPVRSK